MRMNKEAMNEVAKEFNLNEFQRSLVEMYIIAEFLMLARKGMDAIQEKAEKEASLPNFMDVVSKYWKLTGQGFCSTFEH